FVVLAAGYLPSPEVARDIFSHSRKTLAPYKRIRRLEFAELPKTISGKIRRIELRTREQQLRASGSCSPLEFFEEDFGEAPKSSSKNSSGRSEEHTSELQSRSDLVCRLLLEKKKKHTRRNNAFPPQRHNARLSLVNL